MSNRHIRWTAEDTVERMTADFDRELAGLETHRVADQGRPRRTRSVDGVNWGNVVAVAWLWLAFILIGAEVGVWLR